MLTIFRDLSIRSKLTLMTMLTTTMALVVACAGFAIYDVSNSRKELVEELKVHADVIGDNSTAALAFTNSSDAAQTLETLRAATNIEAAAIYAEDGKLFARYTTAAAKGYVFPAKAESNTNRFGPDSLEVFRDVAQNGKKIGTVYVRSNLDRLSARTQRYVGISSLVVLFCGLGALPLAKRLQRFVSDPIQHLAGTAKTITIEKNYSLRATKQSDDELGILIDCFNEMLSQIQERDRNIEQARLDAEHANSAKSDFLAKMSHEIRTPLNGVVGTVQLLLDTELTVQQRRLAQLARSSGDALLALINDILDFSKIEAGKMELEHIAFNPQDIAEEAMDMLGAKAAKKGLDLGCHTDVQVGRTMLGDPDRIRQILTNLINNAIKFTEKGSVVVRLRMERQTKTHCVVKFLVTDTGPGIPAARLHRLFKSFSQVDASTTRKHGGTGLGLAISKQLAEMMGGEIGVESVSGEGSTFWFTVGLEKHQQAEGNAPQLAAMENMRILVATANETHSEVLREQLTTWGFWASTLTKGAEVEEALQRSVRENWPIALVICDSNLPDVNAVELAQRIHRVPEISKTVVMLLTSMDEEVEPQKLAEAGIAGCILKPVHQSQLFDTIIGAMSGEGHAKEGNGGRQENVFAASESLRGARLLVAEDNEVNQLVTGEMLKKLGCVYEMVDDGLKAFNRAIAGGFDLVLMDCQMPTLDGFEATRRIREMEAKEKRPHLPIVALTANAVKGDRELCLAAGMDGYVTKPINVATLVSALEGLLKGRKPGAQAVAAVAGATGGSEQPFDVLSAFDRCMSDANVVGRVLDKFKEHAPMTLAELRKVVGAKDAAETKRLAHGMKGAAANISAEKLRSLSLELEKLGHESQLSAAEELVKQIDAELKRCIEFIPEAMTKLEPVAAAQPPIGPLASPFQP
ncbi:MAG TPA: response regulator [Phycisphaerae bacterium]|nr:response regulator [Phycisphaerae bacterium]